MPKKIPEQELEAIVAIVADHPDSVQIKSIRDGLEFDLPPRMLQCRLALLVKQQRLIVEGRGRGSRYRSPVIIGVGGLVSGEAKVEGRAEVYLSISPEGEVIKQAVCEPIQNRNPVGYNRDFLDEYRPNDTFYLPAEIRQRLLEMGRSPDGQRLAGTYVRKIFSRLLIERYLCSEAPRGNAHLLAAL